MTKLRDKIGSKKKSKKRKRAPVDLTVALAIRPKDTLRLFPGCGTRRLWEWINSGEVESFKEDDGQARWIVVASLKDRVARMVAEQGKKFERSPR